MRCKRGQFYLMSAIIIVGVLIGLAVVSNYVVKKSSVRVYTLRDELEIESEKVLDYGVYSKLSGDSLDALTKSFTDLYADNNENLYFIFGTQTSIKVIGYSTLEDVTINTGSGEQTIVSDGEAHEFTVTQNEITVTVKGSPHRFNLRKGENFYFVIQTTYEGGDYVITN